MRAVLYLRQSDSSGDGDQSISIASQESILRDLAARAGDAVVAVEIDTDLRGWQDADDRVGLQRLLRRATDRDVDVVYVYDLSRLARSVYLQERVFRDLDAAGVTVRSYREPFAGEPLYRQILGAVAEERTRELRAHIQRSVAERSRRGIAHGSAPFGYVRGDDDRLVVDVAAAAVVAELFRRFADGETLAEIVRSLNSDGVPAPNGDRWHPSPLRRMLSKPVYRGAITLHGEIVAETAHDAIVDADTWSTVQAVLQDRQRPRKRVAAVTSWLSGLVRHECGRQAYLDHSVSRGDHRFRCVARNAAGVPCGQSPQTIGRSVIERAVWSQVVADLARIVDAETAIAEARRIYRERLPDAARRRDVLQLRDQRSAERLRRAESLYLDGLRDRSWFDDEQRRCATERSDVAAAMAALPDEPDAEAIRRTEIVLRDIEQHLPHMPDEHRATVMRSLGVVVFGSSGVVLRYAPEVAALVRQ